MHPLFTQAGAGGVHFEDQLASAKKCGHLGGKVLVPTSEFVQKLQAARLAADVCDVPTIIIARTDALGAFLLTSDIDDRDKPFCTGDAGVYEAPLVLCVFVSAPGGACVCVGWAGLLLLLLLAAAACCLPLHCLSCTAAAPWLPASQPSLFLAVR